MTPSPHTIIVTGASSGIGLAVARAFLDRGDNVVLNGRDPDKLSLAVQTLAQPDRTATVAGSIGDAETGQMLVDMAVNRFGGIDGLINNAGTFGVTPFVDVQEKELDGFLTGNLRGTFLTTQAVVRQIVVQGSGGIITNIGTVLIDHAVGAVPASAALVSKGGIHALTHSLAAELAPQNIRVNMVAPGIIRTPLHDGAAVDGLAGLALLNRVGDAEEIADAVLYLHDADFVTGHILPVDGGFVTGRAAS